MQNVIAYLEARDLKLHISQGVERTIIGLVGATQEQKASLNAEALDGVEKVMPVVTPYKLASREFHPEDTIVQVGDLTIGGDELQVMAGPCAVESLVSKCWKWLKLSRLLAHGFYGAALLSREPRPIPLPV